MEKMKRHAKFGHSKTANIERRNYEDLEKAREPSFRRRLRSQSPEKWMQRASRHPGMTRAYLAHKYDLDTAFIYIQPRFWKGDDPFYINEINKAKRMNRTKYAMQYVDSFITEFRTIPMPKKLEEEYDKFKKESRLRLAEESQIYKKIEEAEMTNFNEILDKVNAGSLGLSDAELESYFKKKGYSKRGTTNMILKFWEFYDIDKAK